MTTTPMQQLIMPLAEVDRLRRDHNPHPIRGEHHGLAARARTTDAIRSADAPVSKRIATAPAMISGLSAAPTAQLGQSSTMQIPADPPALAAPAALSTQVCARQKSGSPEHHNAAPPHSLCYPASACTPRSGPSPHHATSGSDGHDRQPREPPM